MATTKTKIELLVEAKVKDALRDLNRTEKEIKDLSKSGSSASNVFGGLKGAIGAVFTVAAIQQVANFGLATAKLADQAGDLRRSLNNLAKKEGLDTVELMRDLRKATAETVSDIDLMKAATQGKFLGVDLKNMPVLFEFAAKRAKDTGQNIGFLVDSIVTGIGRKSPQILDNLGIQMKDLDAEVENLARSTGYWSGKVGENERALYLQQAAVNIANKAIGDSAATTDDATTQMQRLNAQWENFKVIIGDLISGPLSTLLELLNDTLQAINQISSIPVKRISDLKMEIKDLDEQIAKSELVQAENPGFLSKSILKLFGLEDIEALRSRRKEVKAELKALEDQLAGLNTAGGGGAQGGLNQGVKSRIEAIKQESLAILEAKKEALMAEMEQIKFLRTIEQEEIDNRAQGYRELYAEQIALAESAHATISRLFGNLANDIADGAKSSGEAWAGFLKDLKRQIINFLVSEAVRSFVNILFSAFNPGAAALGVGGAVTSVVGSALGSSGGAGKGSLGPVPAPRIRIAPPSQPYNAPQRGAPAPGGGGEVQVRVTTVAPDLATVEAYHRAVNRQVNIPDTDFVNQFNRTQKSEFE